MSKQFQKFKALHHSDELFVLPNAWNARSAKLFHENQFPAIGTSSAAVAYSLGYEDGEAMSFSEYLMVINRIRAVVPVPLTVDIEMGYGKTNEEIYVNLQRLVESGVAGINIEDSVIHGAMRSLQDAEYFARRIEYLKNRLEQADADLFINVRCDCYLLNVEHKLSDAISRTKLYEASGADGIFLPCISDEADIAEVVANTRLPLNVMCIPGLPDFETLNQLGVKRVSMGPFFFNKVYAQIKTMAEEIALNRSFSAILV